MNIPSSSAQAAAPSFEGGDALLLLHTIPDAVFGVDEAGRIVFANTAADALTGMPLTGRAMEDIFSRWPDIAADPRRVGLRSCELRRADGRTLPVELSAACWQSGGRSIIGAVVRNVVDHAVSEAMLEEAQEQAARALAEAETARQRLHDVIELLPQAVCVFDAEHRYVLWNESYAQLYPEIADILAPGILFADVLRASGETGHPREKIEDGEEWLKQRLAHLALPAYEAEEELRDGRWLRYENRRLPSGGAIGMRIDITDLKRREASFRLLFDGNPVPMLLFDPQSLHIREVNDAALGLYGFNREEFLAKTVLDLHTEDETSRAAETYAGIDSVYDSRTVWRQKTVAGEDLHVLLFIRALVHEQRPGLLAAVVDVGDRVRAEKQISHIAHHDPLTGLANRLRFNNALEEAVAARAAGLTVFCLDLDGFKPVNDTYGHKGGDGLLCMVAGRLRAAVGDGDLVARLGGDEFAVIQSGSPLPASVTAERLIATLRPPFIVDDELVSIGVSVGFARLSDDESRDPDQLLVAADHALYAAKRAGKNTWRSAMSLDEEGDRGIAI